MSAVPSATTVRSSPEDTTAPFDNEGYSLLKFHGVYQGYDRDSATELKQRGDSKHWQFMVRVRIPGGRLTAAQYLALDDLAGRHANGSLRVTTRQSIQFHGVVKPGLKAAIAEIDRALLTTLAACGDVVRTVTTVPAPIRDAVHRRLEDDARRLSMHLLPKTGAYHEIWVDGEKVAGNEEPVDPLYGERYLPRKFKIGLAIPEDNTIDVLTNDLGIVALFAKDKLAVGNAPGEPSKDRLAGVGLRDVVELDHARPITPSPGPTRAGPSPSRAPRPAGGTGTCPDPGTSA